jgi:ankyrin repeat protein
MHYAVACIPKIFDILGRNGRIHGLHWSGRPPPHYAAVYFFTLENFLQLGGQINALDSNGRTPLHYTALSDYSHAPSTMIDALFVAQNLVRHGADGAIRDRFGMTAADLAREQGQFEMAQWLQGRIVGNRD